jgi:hypothetical protein
MSARFRSLLSRFDGGMETAEPAPPRRIRATPAGDRAEIWDTAREPIPVVDLTKPTAAAPETAVGSLRRRLASIRWPEGGDAA